MNVTCVLFRSNEINATTTVPITEPEKLLKLLDKDKRTIFYVFGYLETPRDENVQVILKALCYGRTDNIVLLDWSKYSDNNLNKNYNIAFQNGEKVGALFAQSIRLLKNSGLDVSKLYIIGHSLGSHIAGLVGKCNDFVLPRITALDPANPLFYLPGCYLTYKDATWIDVIHTDMGGYGAPKGFLSTSMGTAEFYPNGGTRPQPGCALIGLPLSDTDLCSHRKSVRLYAESKYRPNDFHAMECSSYEVYKTGRCNQNSNVGLGYAALNVSGNFYLTTN